MASARAAVLKGSSACPFLGGGRSDGSIAVESCSLLVSCYGPKTAPRTAGTFLQQSLFLPSLPPQKWPLHGSRLGLQLCRESRVVKFRALPDLFEELDLDDDDSDLEDASFILPEELKDRPRRGFGRAQAYDTSVEDELMKEIESTKLGFTKKRQAGDAPVAAKSSGGAARKSRPPLPPPEDFKGAFPWLLRGTPEDRYPPNTPKGVKVSLGNLPKKKKVGRDLRKALLLVPGLLVIRPSEIGDRDTRDCTCKGAATLIFKDKQYALGFCAAFHGRPIQFGKIERRITAKLSDARQPAAAEASGGEEGEPSGGQEEEEKEEADADVDELIEEGKKKGEKQLQQQSTSEEEGGRKALLDGVAPVEEGQLQGATVKTSRDAEPSRADSHHDSAAETKRVDTLIRKGKEAGSEQLLEQRRREETGGMDALLGTHTEGGAQKEGEDGRSAALSVNVNEAGGMPVAGGGQTTREDAKVGRTLRPQAAAGDGDVNIDDVFDEADLVDDALDDDGVDLEEELDAEGDDEEWDDEEEWEVEVSDILPGMETPPRSSKLTKLLEDGTLIVKGQEVGKVDPTATKEGQLVVPLSRRTGLHICGRCAVVPPASEGPRSVVEVCCGSPSGPGAISVVDTTMFTQPEVAQRISAITGGQPIEVDLVTEAALKQKRAFEEKLVAWHFGQLPGFQGAENPTDEDVTVSWDRANQTMVKGGGFDKAKHKRLKKEQREPKSLQDGGVEKEHSVSGGVSVLSQGRGQEGSDSDDDFEEDEWVLDEDDELEGDEDSAASTSRGRGAGPAPSKRVTTKVSEMSFAELLAMEKREVEEGVQRLRAQNKPVPEVSPEVLETLARLKADPRSFEDADDEEVKSLSGMAKSQRPGRKPAGAQAVKRRKQEAAGSSQGEPVDERSSKVGPKSKKSTTKRQRKPEYGKLIASLPKTL